jgi:hypothetical protein
LTLRAVREAAMGCVSRRAVWGANGGSRRNLQGEQFEVGGTPVVTKN